MGFRIEGPHVVSFLEFASQQFPDALAFSDIGGFDRSDLLARFSALMPTRLARNDRQLRYLMEDGFSRLVEEGYSVISPRNWLQRAVQRGAGNDALARYRAAKTKGIFLYTDQDREFVEYLERYWHAFDAESGSLLHFFDYALDRGVRVGNRRAPYTYAEDYIRSLSMIPGADLGRIRAIGLPCFLVWTDTGESAVVPFADVQGDDRATRDRLREVLDHIARDQVQELRYRFEGIVREAASQTADVFISYRHTDRDWVRDLSGALHSLGVKVWFDEHLQAGDRWDLRIWHMINQAKTVLVVWSRDSVVSDYVLSEAHYARSRRRILPLLKEVPLELPVPFNTMQTVDMSVWSGAKGLPLSLTDPLRAAIGHLQA